MHSGQGWTTLNYYNKSASCASKCIIIHLHLKITNVSPSDVRAKILALLVSTPTYQSIHTYSTSSRELGSGMM